MSTVIEEIEEQYPKWIAYAHDIADGIAEIDPNTLERVARQQHFTSSFRLQLAEKHLRNTFRVLLEAVNGPSRRSVIEFFGKAYKNAHKESVQMVR